MDRERARRLLEALRQELAEAGDLDPSLRASLDRLAAQVGAAADGPVADRPEASLLTELEERALRIESEHPRLAAVLGQIADTLGKLGI